MGLCKYKDSLGLPGKGVHEKRVFGLAIWDVIGTIIIAMLISWKWEMGFPKAFSGVMVATIFIHWIFCVDTALNVGLGLTT